MGLKDILNHLERVLDTPKGRAAKQADAIDELVDKLKAKQIKYQAKLKQAETDHAKQKLERKIKVCQAQIQKGSTAAATLRLASSRRFWLCSKAL